MSLSGWCTPIVIASVGVATLAIPGDVRAAEPGQSQCASAYESSQLLRQRGRLIGARDAALLCARPSCPEVARRDCATWAVEVTREIPTVVVVARDEATGDERWARVSVDGAPRPEAASGLAFELDPGEHVFRVERPGDQPVERSLPVFQGEHDRLLRFVLKPINAPLAPAPLPVPAPARAEVARPVAPSVTYTPGVLVGAASAAALGVSAWLGLTGRSELANLHHDCAPNCTDAQVDPVREKLVASDIMLGVGALGAAAALYLLLRPPSTGGPSTASLVVAPARGGVAVGIGAAF